MAEPGETPRIEETALEGREAAEKEAPPLPPPPEGPSEIVIEIVAEEPTKPENASGNDRKDGEVHSEPLDPAIDIIPQNVVPVDDYIIAVDEVSEH